MGLYEELPLGSTAGTIRLIRLIRLKPAKNRETPISAEVFVASLDEVPEFTCLSYCWGEPTQQQEIDCNGFSLGITWNLNSALTAIRSSSNLPIWCDQISINQQDMTERSAQVSLMGDIYSAARETFVYLGEPNNQALESACRVVRTLMMPPIMRLMKIRRDGSGSEMRARIDQFKQVLLHPHLFKQKHDRSTRKAFTEILAAPFFTRKWVVQEVCLSRSLVVVIGSYHLDWSSLLITALASGHDMSSLPSLTNIWWLWNASDKKGAFQKVPLLSLLYYTKLFQSGEPHDAVYSLLGLASDASDFPRPDYTISLEDLYLTMSRTLIQKGQGALVLRLAGHDPSDPRPALPSWVIDPSNLATSYSPKRYTGFSADDKRTILVTGQIVDRVRAIAAPFSSAHSLWERVALAWADCASAFAGAWPGMPEALQDALRRLTRFDMGPDPDADEEIGEFSQPVFSEDDCEDLLSEAITIIDDTSIPRLMYMVNRYRLSKLRRRIRPIWLCDRDRKSHATPTVLLCRSPREWLRLAEHQLIEGFCKDSVPTNLSRWKFFDQDTRPVLMESGKLGLLPTAAKAGDVVALVKGGRMPILLRETGNEGGQKKYSLIGEGMVQGLMFGESIQKPGPIGEKQVDNDFENEKKRGNSMWEEIAIG